MSEVLPQSLGWPKWLVFEFGGEFKCCGHVILCDAHPVSLKLVGVAGVAGWFLCVIINRCGVKLQNVSHSKGVVTK
jgi:hypothetical protein